MRAALYLRISQDRTGEGLGVDRQRQDCQRLVEQRGWTLTSEFTDNDRSAAGRKPRPRFLALLDAVEAGQLDVIVSWALDRLARTARDRLALVEACQRRRVMIALCRGSDMDPTNSAGRLAIGILGEVAQHEIDAKSERQIRAVDQAAEQGRWIGGRKPFGYAGDGVTILEEEADAVRAGYAALLSGASLRSIAASWNAAGHRTGQAPWKHLGRGERSPWRADSVARVLANPRYAGIRTLTREGKTVEHGTAMWPALIAVETLRAARRLLADPGRRSGGGGNRQLLTGLALCGCPGCGRTVHGGGAGHGKPIYRCGSSTLGPAERGQVVAGTHVNRLAAPVHDYIEQVVLTWARHPDVAARLAASRGPDAAGLRDQAVRLRRRMEEIAAEFGKDMTISPAELRAMRAPIVRELGEVDAALADAGRVDVLSGLTTAEDVSAQWAKLDVARRQLVIDMLMVVRLHPVGRGVRTFRPETVEIIPR